jgi:hypothetical protein
MLVVPLAASAGLSALGHGLQGLFAGKIPLAVLKRRSVADHLLASVQRDLQSSARNGDTLTRLRAGVRPPRRCSPPPASR